LKARHEREVFTRLQRSISDLEKLSHLFPDVCARDDEPATIDGHRTSSRGEGGSRGTGDPTGNKVVVKVDFGTTRDPVHNEVERLFANLLAIAKGVENSLNIANHVLKVAPTFERVQAVPDCTACGELALPRPKSGYCGACYEAWRKFRVTKHDRAAFEVHRRAQKAEQLEVAE